MPILELKANESAIRRIMRAIWGTLFRRRQTSADKLGPGVEWPADAGSAKEQPDPSKLSRQRLAEAVVRLERLDAQRERRGDSSFGKTTENRIIWSELIELEMQEIDEQVSRICSSAGRPTQSNRRGGGAHERDDS
jgi:hypothetical protein